VRMTVSKPLGLGETMTSEKQHDEVRLVKRAKQGDRQAISELYRRHVDAVYRYVYARVRDPEVARDLTAQTFVKVLEGLPNYQLTGAPFLSWIHRIAHARTVDHWRKQYRSREVPLVDDERAGSVWPADTVVSQENSNTALDLLARLTDDQQAVLILRFIGEMKLSEVADVLGKTREAVTSTQHRALASLARLLQIKGGERPT
jgi:RNA polymerase sigma-70 factor (ECF subfamily)